jgi:hypothetical protein
VIEHARTNVEFMSKHIKDKMEERGGENPFDLRHVERISSMADLQVGHHRVLPDCASHTHTLSFP